MKLMSKILATLILTCSFSSFAGLSDVNFKKAMKCLGKAESNNNYKAVNTLGYLGRYQFGAQALEDIGYVKKGCYKKYKNKVPSSCWTGVNTVYSRKGYLNNTKAQDDALNKLFKLNNRRLLRNGTLHNESTQVEIGKALFISHLLGVRAAKRYFKSDINDKDAYGTRASDYSKLAQKCFKR